MSLNTPVLFLAGGGSDRSIAACVRVLSNYNIPYHIIQPKHGKRSPWCFTKYRHSVISERYSQPGNVGEYKNSIKNATKNLENVILFPTSERTYQPLLEDNNFTQSCGIITPTSEIDKYRKLSNKQSFMQLAEDAGIDTPNDINKDIDDIKPPLVAKPSKEFTEDGTQLKPHLINSKEEKYSFRREEDYDSYFYQEYINGDGYYYCAVYDEGEPICEFTQKTVLQQPNGGSVIKAVPSTLPNDLIEKFNKLIQQLCWSGPLMVEFRKSNDGKYYAIEVNPRLWGPLQLLVDNGVDLPLAIYNLASNGESLSEDICMDDQENNRNIGYFRHNALLVGWWKKMLIGGSFDKSNLNKMEELNDVWLRTDTLPIYAYNVSEGAIYPLAKFYYDPELIVDKLYNRL